MNRELTVEDQSQRAIDDAYNLSDRCVADLATRLDETSTLECVRSYMEELGSQHGEFFLPAMVLDTMIWRNKGNDSLHRTRGSWAVQRDFSTTIDAIVNGAAYEVTPLLRELQVKYGQSKDHLKYWELYHRQYLQRAMVANRGIEFSRSSWNQIPPEPFDLTDPVCQDGIQQGRRSLEEIRDAVLAERRIQSLVSHEVSGQWRYPAAPHDPKRDSAIARHNADLIDKSMEAGESERLPIITALSEGMKQVAVLHPNIAAAAFMAFLDDGQRAQVATLRGIFLEAKEFLSTTGNYLDYTDPNFRKWIETNGKAIPKTRLEPSTNEREICGIFGNALGLNNFSISYPSAIPMDFRGLETAQYRATGVILWGERVPR